MEEFLRPQELLIILLIVLVLFGGAKLPELARNLGRAQRELRAGFREGSEEEDAKKASGSGSGTRPAPSADDAPPAKPASVSDDTPPDPAADDPA